MRNRRRIRLVRRFVLGLAVAAIVAPAAQAYIPAESGAFGGGAAAVRPHGATVQGENKGQLPEAVYVPFVTDFPQAAPAPGGENASPLGYRRALPQDYGAVPVEVVRDPSTFDWGDALMGAGGAFVLLLIAGGATLATRHIRRPAAA